MRDLVVREGLEAMARDAAKRFRELTAAGEEIPYEVREPDTASPLCQYEPLTERFVRDHAGALRELDSFGASCAALEAADLAGAYLESMGVVVPVSPRERAELAGVAFLCRLWMDSSDFSLDRERLDAAIDELEAGGETALGEVEVAVPLRGFQMPAARLELGAATIVRADTVDVPAEARVTDGLGGSPWEPTFLAVVRVDEPDLEAGSADESADGAVAAVAAFRRLITTLRLFKAGGVSLGPHAWTRSAGDRWRRISTGAGRPRPGGYRLSETELAELAAFSRALAGPSTPFGRQAAGRPGLPTALGRALSRFEAGLERVAPLDGLNDYLLALRFVLEGAGPAALGLPMRVAALCAEPERRDAVKAIVDRGVALERELWSGEPAPRVAGPTPAEAAAALEELARAILKDAACGHLGSDLRVTADEILLADGLAVGDGSDPQRGSTAEWDLGEEVSEVERRIPEPEGDFEPEEETMNVRPERRANEPSEPETTNLELAAEPEAAPEHEPAHGPEAAPPNPVLRLIEQTNAERQQRRDRVANLFPPPEPCEWNVREIAYDRRRRAEVSS